MRQKEVYFFISLCEQNVFLVSTSGDEGKKYTWFTVQRKIELKGLSKEEGYPSTYRQSSFSVLSNFLSISLWKNRPCHHLLSTFLCFPSGFPTEILSPRSCLISSFLPIFSPRLLSKQTVFSKIGTDSACHFCFMLLSTKGYDISTWCISVLNTIEKKARPQRVKALMKTMSTLVRSPGCLNPVSQNDI